MKHKIALLCTALLLFGFAQAQVSKESYEKAVDLLNCKTVELTLPKENIQQYQQQCDCNATDFAQINKFLTSVGKLDATIALSNEVESLKKSFKENWKKEDVVTFLSESIFTDKKFQKIAAFADKRKGKPEFNSYKLNLKTDVANALVESVTQETVTSTNTSVQQPNVEDRISKLEENQNTKKDDNGILGGLADYLILFSILLGVIALLLALRKPSSETDYDSLIDKLIRSQRMNSHFQSQQSVFRNTSNNNSSSAELRDANNRIRDLETQIEKIKSQLSTTNPVSSYTAQTTQPTYQEVKQPEVITQTFFLSTPNSDGSFNESSASSTFKDGATIYRFTKIGDNRAKFQIDEKDASARLALQYPDKNIDPVCDAVNAFNPKATRIITVEQGEAELQNGKWVVDRNKKAKIKYEN
jgi:hypothetical protein